MNKKLLSFALVGTLALGILAGCGAANKETSAEGSAPAEKGDKTIVIGASATPHAEILEAVKDEFKSQGYELKIQEFTDYVKPNKALADGELDANFFQHKPYLDNFNEENKTDLTATAFVHYEPMAIFPGKTKALADIKEGAKIAVPNDASNEARALLLLADNGIITLKEDAGITATVRDIAENPKKVEIVEMEAAQIPRAIQDLDLAVINGNFAIASGLDFTTNLAAEDKDSIAANIYANIIAMRTADKDSDKAKVIHDILTGDKVKAFIGEKYKGTVLPVDETKAKAAFDTDKK